MKRVWVNKRERATQLESSNALITATAECCHTCPLELIRSQGCKELEKIRRRRMKTGMKRVKFIE